MKKSVFTLLLGLVLGVIGLQGQTTLFSESFETDGEGTRYNSNHAGTCSDFFERVNSSPTCFGETVSGQNGTWYFASEDVHDRPGGGDGIITFSTTNASGYNNLQVSLLLTTSDLAPAAFEVDDHVFIQYAFDANIAANNYSTFGLFQGQPVGGLSGPLRIDTDNNPNTPGPYGSTVNANGAMSSFSFGIPATGSLLSIRIIIAQDGGSEELAFDLVALKGDLALNNAPVLANIEAGALNYTEGNAATQVTNTITVSDAENDNIVSATAQIVFGYESGADMLSFTPQFGITGSFLGGTLALSGSATPAQYQTVLRSVTYFNTNTTNPSIVQRTVRFRVSDGANSNFEDRNINFTQTLNGPVALPACESFETDGHGTRYYAYEFNDGLNNFWERHNASGGAHPSHSQAILGATGSYIWASEDVSEPSNPNPAQLGEMLLQPFTATGLGSFDVEVDLAAATASWEPDDYLFVQYRMDGGSWTSIGAFYGNATFGGPLTEDADLNGTADAAGTQLTATLQRFSYNFVASGSALEVRLLHKSDGTEELGFDRICVSGTATCTQPDVPTVSANGVCTPITLSVTGGNLNDATNWVWYTGSCGGTQINTGASIMVSPNSPTTYYVWGEGGCVTPGSCASITVTPDQTPPSITCPANISVNSEPGQCGAVITFEIDFSDNCPGEALSQTGGQASGTLFPVGTTTNTFVVTDALGNKDSCSFTVTVNDSTPPSITCPANISVNSDPGQCGAVVTFEIDFSDNCPGGSVSQTSGLASGTLFPVGTTTNTFVATDAYGNKDSCSFTVTVNDTTSPTMFIDSICPGDSLFVGGAWQTEPGVYTDTAFAASGCDSLLITTLYYRPDSICNPTPVETILYIVSDSAWTLSTVVTVATSNSFPWPGAAPHLPHDSTFSLPAEVGQPFPWTHLYTVMGSEVIKSGGGVTYYRYEFDLTEHQALNARFRMFVDDDMQIFVNRQEVALEDDMGQQNWRTANHDILFNDNGTVENGYSGGDPFDSYTTQNLDNVFVTGVNDLILAIRNRTSKPDVGGFSFRMDLDKAGQGVIVKKEADMFLVGQFMPGLDVYPNPVADRLKVLMENANPDKDYTITVSDLSGKIMERTSANGNQLQAAWSVDVSGLAAGVYFIKVDSGNQSVVERFVKQ